MKSVGTGWEDALKKKATEDWKKVGTGFQLGHRVNKYQKEVARFNDGRIFIMEVWTLADPKSSTPVVKLYGELFTMECPHGLPAKRIVYVIRNGKRLRTYPMSEVVKIENVAPVDPDKFFNRAAYKRVSDLFTVFVGQDGSEFELMFQDRPSR